MVLWVALGTALMTLASREGNADISLNMHQGQAQVIQNITIT